MTKTSRGKTTNLSRRRFLVSTAATGGGLALGFQLPFTAAEAATQTAAPAPEINAWVVVKPDSTCVIRIARSEMGQGTLTGLAQLVAEELEADARKTLPKNSPQLATQLSNYGAALLEAGAFAGAERLLRESLTTYEKGSANFWGTFSVRSMLGGAFMLSGFLFDLRSMPAIVRTITYVLPARYFVALLQTAFLAGDVWEVILPNGAVLAGMAGVLLLACRLVTRKRLE